MSSPSSSLKGLRIERPVESTRAGFSWLLALFGLVIIAAAGLGGWHLTRAKAVDLHTAVARDATPSAAGSERTVLNASGYVTARREATVSSKITGKVSIVYVEEGMKINEGQILARLDDTNVSSSLNLALAQMEATKSSLEEIHVRLREAEKDRQRQEVLNTKKIAAQSETDKIEASALALRAKLQQQVAEVAVQQRTIESWRQQYEDTIIRAPFSGIVTSKNAQPGEMISPMSAGGSFTRTGICTVVDMESLEIEIDVNESYINRVSPGQAVEATLDAYPEWKIPCKVIAIIPTADRQKSTVRVRVGFDKLDPRILPEMSVKVGFREATPRETSTTAPAANRLVAIPKSALFQDEGRDIVFVVQNGKAERRAVTVGNSSPDEAVLSAGVSPGERVAIERPEGLTEGTRVRESTK